MNNKIKYLFAIVGAVLTGGLVITNVGASNVLAASHN